ncbi:MAG: hypothetical protein WBB34_22615 [Xanthobacteraceae bacterium]
MSFLSSNALIGLPALIGVVLGLKLYITGFDAVFYLLFVLGVAAIALNIGYNVMPWYPRVGGYLIELWILSAIGITAFATAAITWMSLSGPLDYIVNAKQLGTEQTKTMAAALVTAVTTYVALVWTKDIGDAEGYFWPSTHFRNALQQAAEQRTNPIQNDTQIYDAIYDDTVRGYGELGWDFGARRTRAKLYSEFI